MRDDLARVATTVARLASLPPPAYHPPMLYTLFVKPIALAGLGFVVWVLWRASAHLAPADRRAHRLAVGAGAVAITALTLGPPAWEALRDSPGEVAIWAFWLTLAALAAWAYARLLAAARRRAGERGRK